MVFVTLDHIRNLAIIAHVDHGKTSLVDCLLRQSGTFREGTMTADLIMDSNPQEKERGITIFAKNCSIVWKDYKINLIDTPGHADFGGEVERVLKMADACLVLVDAFEGPMPQTRFVLKKAFGYKLKPIVVINKIDRPDARVKEVLDEIYDLFIDMGCHEDELDFPIIYSSAKHGYARYKPDDTNMDVVPLFEEIVKSVPPPVGSVDKPVQMLVTTLEYSDYVGRIAIGRIFEGKLAEGQKVMLISRDGHRYLDTIDMLYCYEGLGRKRVTKAEAGDIVAVGRYSRSRHRRHCDRPGGSAPAAGYSRR